MALLKQGHCVLIEKASQTAPAQIIRIEQAPLNLTAAANQPKKEEPPVVL